jgi:hypothetical protein
MKLQSKQILYYVKTFVAMLCVPQGPGMFHSGMLHVNGQMNTNVVPILTNSS